MQSLDQSLRRIFAFVEFNFREREIARINETAVK